MKTKCAALTRPVLHHFSGFRFHVAQRQAGQARAYIKNDSERDHPTSDLT